MFRWSEVYTTREQKEIRGRNILLQFPLPLLLCTLSVEFGSLPSRRRRQHLAFGVVIITLVRYFLPSFIRRHVHPPLALFVRRRRRSILEKEETQQHSVKSLLVPSFNGTSVVSVHSRGKWVKGNSLGSSVWRDRPPETISWAAHFFPLSVYPPPCPWLGKEI